MLNKEQEQELKPLLINLVTVSELAVYFEENLKVYNERSILSKNGNLLIPDRIVFKGKKVTVIDYKTGAFDKKHEEQVENYASVLQEMNYEIDKKLLVYLDSKITIREVR